MLRVTHRDIEKANAVINAHAFAAHLNSFEMTDQRGQRRAQIMRHVGHPFATIGVDAFHLLRLFAKPHHHRPKRARHATNFIRAQFVIIMRQHVEIERAVRVLRAHGVRCIGQTLERSRDQREHGKHQQRTRQRATERHGDRAAVGVTGDQAAFDISVWWSHQHVDIADGF